MWYQRWIPYFKVKVQPLHEITNTNECDVNIASELWTKEAEDTWNFVIQVIVSDPCFARWDFRQRFYTQTDFCTKGMDFVGMQPARDPISMAAMRRKMEGGK
jgi:hypothetical protein